MLIALAIVCLLLLLALGTPIYAALGGLAATLLLWHGAPPVAIAQIVLDKLNSNSIVAIPFFVLAAGFMERGGMARALIGAAEGMLAGTRGGLALVCVAATTVFAAVSGSSVATAMAMSAALVPTMLARGYRRDFALGIIGASGTLGILIPPSIILIIYGIIAEQSIPRLFLAGAVPGLLQALLFSMFVLAYARWKDLPAAPRLGTAEAFGNMLRAVPALAVPMTVFVGIYGGYATVAEAAALAAALSFVAGGFFYRGFVLREAPAIAAVALRRSAVIIVIVAGAVLFAHWLTETGAPQRLVEAVVDINLSAWQFLLAMNIIMLFLGMILEGVSIILITVPLLLPVLAALDINPIHYAIIVVINIELAMLTPPVGLNLYVLSGAAKAPVGEVARGALPFVLIMVVLLLVITFFPALSLWLPEYFFG